MMFTVAQLAAELDLHTVSVHRWMRANCKPTRCVRAKGKGPRRVLVFTEADAERLRREFKPRSNMLATEIDIMESMPGTNGRKLSQYIAKTYVEVLTADQREAMSEIVRLMECITCKQLQLLKSHVIPGIQLKRRTGR